MSTTPKEEKAFFKRLEKDLDTRQIDTLVQEMATLDHQSQMQPPTDVTPSITGTPWIPFILLESREARQGFLQALLWATAGLCLILGMYLGIMGLISFGLHR